MSIVFCAKCGDTVVSEEHRPCPGPCNSFTKLVGSGNPRILCALPADHTGPHQTSTEQLVVEWDRERGGDADDAQAGGSDGREPADVTPAPSSEAGEGAPDKKDTELFAATLIDLRLAARALNEAHGELIVGREEASLYRMETALAELKELQPELMRRIRS